MLELREQWESIKGYLSLPIREYYQLSDQNLVKIMEAASNRNLLAISYEVRSRLTPMIGFLRLVIGDLVDSSE